MPAFKIFTMKQLIIILLCLWSISSQAQTTGYFRYDTIRMQRSGGNSELIIENATRAVTGGVLTNQGGGRTAFVVPAAGGTNTSIGSGYKIAVNGTNNIKSLTATNGLTADSATAGQVGVKLGGTLTGNTAIVAGGNNFQIVNIGQLELTNSAGSAIELIGGNVGINANSWLNISATDSIYMNTLTNLTSQDRIIGQRGATGRLGYLTLGTNLSMSAGVINAASASLTVGTTAIASGTSGRVLYNNAGVLGEYTTTGTGTELVKSNTPTLIDGASITGAFPDLDLNATSGNPFISQSLSGVNKGFWGTSGSAGAFITNSVAGDMCFRAQTFMIKFSADGGTTEHMNIKTTGVVQMGSYGAGTATFDASGNISSVSDERLKTDIKFYKTGLKELMNINPIQYKWNSKSGMETGGTYAGFSAQNVKDNIPLGTGENKDGYLSLQDRALLATLVNAVKEQQREIQNLKKEIKRLQK